MLTSVYSASPPAGILQAIIWHLGAGAYSHLGPPFHLSLYGNYKIFAKCFRENFAYYNELKDLLELFMYYKKY